MSDTQTGMDFRHNNCLVSKSSVFRYIGCLKSELIKVWISDKFGFQTFGFQAFTVIQNQPKLVTSLVIVPHLKLFFDKWVTNKISSLKKPSNKVYRLRLTSFTYVLILVTNFI